MADLYVCAEPGCTEEVKRRFRKGPMPQRCEAHTARKNYESVKLWHRRNAARKAAAVREGRLAAKRMDLVTIDDLEREEKKMEARIKQDWKHLKLVRAKLEKLVSEQEHKQEQ